MTVTIRELKDRIDTELARIKDALLECEDPEETASMQADGRALLKIRKWIGDPPGQPRTVSPGSGY